MSEVEHSLNNIPENTDTAIPPSKDMPTDLDSTMTIEASLADEAHNAKANAAAAQEEISQTNADQEIASLDLEVKQVSDERDGEKATRNDMLDAAKRMYATAARSVLSKKTLSFSLDTPEKESDFLLLMQKGALHIKTTEDLEKVFGKEGITLFDLFGLSNESEFDDSSTSLTQDSSKSGADSHPLSIRSAINTLFEVPSHLVDDLKMFLEAKYPDISPAGRNDIVEEIKRERPILKEIARHYVISLSPSSDGSSKQVLIQHKGVDNVGPYLTRNDLDLIEKKIISRDANQLLKNIDDFAFFLKKLAESAEANPEEKEQAEEFLTQLKNNGFAYIAEHLRMVKINDSWVPTQLERLNNLPKSIQEAFEIAIEPFFAGGHHLGYLLGNLPEEEQFVEAVKILHKVLDECINLSSSTDFFAEKSTPPPIDQAPIRLDIQVTIEAQHSMKPSETNPVIHPTLPTVMSSGNLALPY